MAARVYPSRSIVRALLAGLGALSLMLPGLWANSAYAQTAGEQGLPEGAGNLPIPLGGLRALEGEEEASSDERFRTTGQIRADELTERQLEELRRISPAADAALITGGIATDAQGNDAALRGALDNADADPFAALGLRRGPLTWFPALDVVVGYDSNPDGVANPRAVRTLRLAPQLRVESDWRRHGFTAEASGSVTFYDDDRDVEAGLDLDAALRLDVGRDTTATLRGTYSLDGEEVGNANAAATASRRTLTQAIGGEATIARRVGLAQVSAGARVERFLFDDTDLTGGGAQSNDDRDRTDITGTLRLERAEGPLLRPFVEGSLVQRRFDADFDRNGFERNSLGYGLRGGLIVADGLPLRGSVSVGLVGETFDDAALEDVTALAVAAGLTWDVTALTSVTLDLSTELDPTTLAGSGVSTTRSAALGVSHQLRRDLALRLGASVVDEDFSGVSRNERTYAGTAGVTWTLSRVMAVRVDGTYEHEPDSPDDIDRFAIDAGITLRR